MKLIAVLLTMLVAVNAQALGDRVLDMSGCRNNISVDSGSSSKLGYSDQWDSCDCKYAPMNAGYCFGSVQSGGGACQWGLSEWGSTIAGGTCCYDASVACRVENGEIVQTQNEATEVQASAEVVAELESVFGVAPRSTSYFGYLNSTNRSPTSGRTVAAEAKLDACIGHGNVDYIRNNVATFNQLSTCRGSSYCGSSHNGACTKTEANLEQLCQDRCDCVFSGSCDGY